MVLLTVAGDQVPVTPLSDVVGSMGAGALEQIVEGMDAKTGLVYTEQQVFEAGGTQGYPTADMIVKVTLEPGSTPKTS